MVKNDHGIRLACGLLLIIYGMHYLGDNIASGYDQKVAAIAARAWEYVLRGFGGAAVLCAIGLLARSIVVWPVCLWGMAEDAERGICRLAHPMSQKPPETGIFTGLCGAPMYWIGLLAAAVIAVICLDKFRGQK